MIYIISDGELVKIGHSKNPHKRLAQLQTGHPKRLKLIALFEWETKGKITERIMEGRIHYLLRQFKVRYNGEWFKFSDNEGLIELINRILNHALGKS